MEASVWRVGRIAEDRLMHIRFIKAASSKNGEAKEIESKSVTVVVLLLLLIYHIMP